MILYPLLAVINLLFTAVAMALAPLVALFASADGWLPNWLCWFQTFDASLDAGWRDGYFPVDQKPAKPLARWWLRVRWLWRNPAYGFCYWPLGRRFDPSEWSVTYRVTPTSSFFWATGPRGAFNLSYSGQWGEWKLGWKAWNYFSRLDESGRPVWKTASWGPEWRVPLCFTPNPFKRR